MTISLPQDVVNAIQTTVQKSLKDSIDKFQGDTNAPEWFNLDSASKYVGVSRSTIDKFLRLGLQVTKIDGVQRINRHNLDSFMMDHEI